MHIKHNYWSKTIAIYVHWPFCLSKCPYCDFNSHVSQTINHQNWLDAYLKELEYFSDSIKGKYISSIFFGGGTPSLMSPYIVEAVISQIAKLGTVDQYTEITLEANPTSYERGKFIDFKQAGINRVSVGVQSLRAKDLTNLGRNHNVLDALETIESVQTIFNNSSFDLIYARPGQTLEDWQTELGEAISIADKHISLYQLTIEKGTSFFKLHREGNLILPDNEVAASMYEWTDEFLSESKLFKYEISNYAKAGFECKHNLTYWNYTDYVGIGPGAHSRISFENDGVREVQAIMTFHEPNKWLKKVSGDHHGIQSLTMLNNAEIIEETLMMGLRLTQGINLVQDANFSNLNLTEAINQTQLNFMIQQQLVIYNDNNLKLTNKGLLLHNYLIPKLIN